MATNDLAFWFKMSQETAVTTQTSAKKQWDAWLRVSLLG